MEKLTIKLEPYDPPPLWEPQMVACVICGAVDHHFGRAQFVCDLHGGGVYFTPDMDWRDANQISVAKRIANALGKEKASA